MQSLTKWPHFKAARSSTLIGSWFFTRRSASVQKIQKHRPTRALSRQSTTSAVLSFQSLASNALKPIPGWAAGTAVCSTVYILGISVLLQGLTPAAVLHSWVLGVSVYAAFGWRGYTIVSLYFLLASGGSVWGSGLAGTVCAVAALITQHHGLWKVGFVASFVSKFSDTISSEIGKAFGRTTYLSTTLRQVPRGTEGAVSLEGTIAGIGAAAGLAGLASLMGLVSPTEAQLVILAAFLANWFESVLGAITQGSSRFSWLTNDIVNVLQTCVAAYLAMFFIDF